MKPPPMASNSTRSPFLMRPSLTATAQRQRNRRRRGVAVTIDGQHHLLRCNMQLVRRRIDDALVGLMRHEPVDVVGAWCRWP